MAVSDKLSHSKLIQVSLRTRFINLQDLFNVYSFGFFL